MKEIRLQEMFFTLLKIGLWGKETRLKLKSTLRNADWEYLWHAAKVHTVEGVIFDSFEFLNEDQLPPRELLLKWAVRVHQVEVYNKKVTNVIALQSELFAKLGVDPLLLKGQGVGSFYRNPFRRVCGDIDWWFNKADYTRVIAYLKKRNVDLSFPLNSVGYKWDGVHCDHHSVLFDIFNPLKRTFLMNLYAESRSKERDQNFGSSRVSVLAPELQMVQVNTHILKHLLSSGIGLRQLCDAAVLCRAYDGEVDEERLLMIYKRLGINKWINVLHAVLIKYIGVPEKSIPVKGWEGIDGDWMLEQIWHSGNFGTNQKMTKIRGAEGNPTIQWFKEIFKAFNLYYRYAPYETLFFPVERLEGGIRHIVTSSKGRKKKQGIFR